LKIKKKKLKQQEQALKQQQKRLAVHAVCEPKMSESSP
jgi:hypothetical protein